MTAPATRRPPEVGTTPRIAVVIPCYRVRDQVLAVLDAIGPEVGWIFVVDDACPQQTGQYVQAQCRDPRVQVLFNPQNLGVGGAVIAGYRAALATPALAIVKLDGDGQMDPAHIQRLCAILLSGRADYIKGNRFHRLTYASGMPWLRLVGNAALSLLTRLSSGYWQIFDPTNGYTAIRREVVAELDLHRIAPRYFFESDMLYHLNQIRAVVVDFPLRAHYAGEPSSLQPLRQLFPFLRANLRNTLSRVLYGYFIRGFSVASLELVAGAVLLALGLGYGAMEWVSSDSNGLPATPGKVMLAALPIILGVQLLLSWLHFDVSSEPRLPVHTMLGERQGQ